MTAARLPSLRSEQGRRRQLAVTKRRATALLAAVTVVFIIVSALGHGTLAGYLQATAEASMVGGLADWFAVTALFRRPLGLPIPHTAIVAERKDHFAATFGDFIRESFLTPEAIVDRVRAANVVPRIAEWLGDTRHADRLAAQAADGASVLADLLREDDVRAVIEGLVRERVEDLQLAPLAGRALRYLSEGGRHDDVMDLALGRLDRYLSDHRVELKQHLRDQSPWWLPGAVEDRVFERLLDGARALLSDMAHDDQHQLRKQFEEGLLRLAIELETSPPLRERAEQLKHEVLAQPRVRDWASTVWADLKAHLRAQASDPDSELRHRLAEAIVATGERLRSDPTLQASVQDGVEAAARYVAGHFDGEIAGLVGGTIARWDGRETSYRLELLLGPDLQYIRINGTVVGAATGLVLHLVARALG